MEELKQKGWGNAGKYLNFLLGEGEGEGEGFLWSEEGAGPGPRRKEEASVLGEISWIWTKLPLAFLGPDLVCPLWGGGEPHGTQERAGAVRGAGGVDMPRGRDFWKNFLLLWRQLQIKPPNAMPVFKIFQQPLYTQCEKVTVKLRVWTFDKLRPNHPANIFEDLCPLSRPLGYWID